ncbi:hypothetical protein DCS_05618 [Drechmeria coniospora]|uniref:Uncharacterized protein n=1 Tax=Drechmeria coniospora TaxID=98403 RepID=A0A151GNI7_DRECN|nr:hypothetical protein DCS_05618 [Drechmeria coniospora]KYK58601.1 hypothetical protein DCS_05618 [Drechmeria coniospora]
MSEMDFEHFPFLNHEEFSEACHHFESQYCRAELGPLRKRWKLRLCAALDTTFSTHGPYATYLQISRPLERILDHPDLSLGLGKLTFSEKDGRDAIIKADDGMMDAEEADSAVVIHHLRDREAEHVTYEIHLHPTYRVPCLWFTLHNLPSDEPALDVDTVFRHLVPDEFKDGLRRVGGIGGISVDVSTDACHASFGRQGLNPAHRFMQTAASLTSATPS